MIIVLLNLVDSSFSKSKTPCPVFVSKFPLGSSARIIFGPFISALAGLDQIIPQAVLLYPMLHSLQRSISEVAFSFTWINPQTHSQRSQVPAILKSVILCLCGAVPFNITILNIALKLGEVELT